MADDMKAMRRKRVASEVTEESMSRADDSPKKVKKMRRYIVRPGHRIRISETERVIGGDVIKLDSKMAKHFMSHDCVSPYVEFNEDDD